MKYKIKYLLVLILQYFPTLSDTRQLLTRKIQFTKLMSDYFLNSTMQYD